MSCGWVVFDLDGTLIESEQIWRNLRREFVAEHGGRWTEDAQRAMMGMRTQEWANYMHEVLKVPLAPREIERRIVERVSAELSKKPPILPGADAVLVRLSGAFVLALATSSAYPVANAVLAATGWSKYFTVVVSADSVHRGKPAPDVYILALELLKADVARSVAIEDSGNGIRSAHRAHLSVVAIPNREFRPDAGSLALASRVLDHLGELSVATVCSVIDDALSR